MGSITLLLGRTRARRLGALPAERGGGVGGAGRPATLHVTDSPRRKEALEQELIRQQGARLSFEPKVHVLGELLDDLALRHAGGRAILPERSLALVAGRVLDERGARWPWLRQLGGSPAVGEALGALHQQLAEHRRDVLRGVPHEGELREALAAMDRAVDRVPGHRTRAQALGELLAALRDPPPALTEWLRSAQVVVLDDLAQPSPLRRQLLIELSRAWALAGAHVVHGFRVGVDLGGLSAERFFEYGDLDEAAWLLKPFAATRLLRRELAEALLGEGDTRVVMASAQGPVEVDPAEQSPGEEDPDLSDLLVRTEPWPLGADPAAGAAALTGQGRVRLLRCADPDAELRVLAREVKEALLAGVRPSDCVVALADLSARADALRAVFADHGVPCALSGGLPLLRSPVPRLLLRISRIPLRGWPAQELLDLLRSDLLFTRKDLRPERLSEWCRAAGVREGLPETWEAPLRRYLEGRYSGEDLAERLRGLGRSLEALGEICSWMAPLAERASAEEYRERLLFVVDQLRLTGRLGRAEDPEVARANLQAWGAALRQLEALTQDLRVVAAERLAPTDLATLLELALERGTWQPDLGGGASQVHVLPLAELRGLTPRRLWVGGLVRGAFPAQPPVPFLLPRRPAWELQPSDPIAEARGLFCTLLRETLRGDATERLTLSWAGAQDGKPLAPSPILEELLSMPTALHGGEVGVLRPWVVEDVALEGPEPLSRSDLLRAAGASPAWAALLDGERAALAAQAQVVQARGPEAALGRWDGILERPPAPPEELAVTALESYLACPARYWYGRVLRLGPQDEWDPELAADRRGTALHRVLEEFLKRRGLRGLREDPVEVLARDLYRVAAEVLDSVEREGGFDAEVFRWRRERWLAGLTDEAPKGVLRCWLEYERAQSPTVEVLAVEQEFRDLQLGPLRLRGKIDRLDRVGGGLLILDYKSGASNDARFIDRGLALQPVAYSDAVARLHPGEPVASVYLSLKDPEEVKPAGWSGDPQLVKALSGRTQRNTFERPRARELLEHAADSARRLVCGRFHPTLAGEKDARCERCDFARVCRVDHARNAARDAQREDLQAPLGPREGG